MNYSTLNNLVPSIFRPIGYTISLFALLLGFYKKMFLVENVEHNTFIISQVVMLFGLLLVLSAKEKIEDERILMIRQQVWNHGYWMTIGFLIAKILLINIYGGSIGSAGTVSLLIGIAILQVIIFEASKKGELLDWMEKNRAKYLIMMILFLGVFYISNQWYWYA